MRASVVIPTRDRPEALDRCLAALRGLEGAEIVVVDDGSTQQKRVAEIALEARAKLVRLEGIGPAAARNAGVQAAQGEVICFTDDDCEVGAGWVQKLVAPIVAGDAECAAGLTTVASNASAADRAWQAIANYLQQVAAEPGSSSPGFAPTCNLACSRKLLTELPFDESFPTAAGEDRDWATRAATGGSAPIFIPEALVTHRPGLDTRSFLRQQYRYGRGAARYRATGADRKLGSLSFYARLWRAGFSENLQVGALICAAQLATAAGIAVERGRFAAREGMPLERADTQSRRAN
jgi:GT2 family glycosyltransferase